MSDKEEFLARFGDPDTISRNLDHNDRSVRIAAASHPLIDEYELDKALTNDVLSVRSTAAGNPNVLPRHLFKAFNDTYPVNVYAKMNPKAKEYGLVKD